MKLRGVYSVVGLGRWMQERGFSPGEHPAFGGVSNTHTRGATSSPNDDSLHYSQRALDVNDRDVDDTVRGQFSSEAESLKWLYGRILTAAEAHRWPLDEMFFDGLGFIKERGFDHNHPIGGHDGHLHVGFTTPSW